ncbi:MAG: CBS domain-containing protein [Gammaproteobacteria bacterium]|nr:CBS domain-containing protein [Gammaproteobacteria bacterium]
MSEPRQDHKRTWRDWVADLFSGEPADRGELLEVLRDASERSILDGEALNIIFGALQVSDMHARDVMIPRSQLVSVKADIPLPTLLVQIIESQHSRFPVIGDDLDDIKGILHAKDLLPLLLRDDRDDFDLKDCIRPAAIIPESKRLNILLQEFRQTRNHMAVVIDEYGHVSGVVTIEDVLEQIVGEIEDEYDVDDDSFIKELDSGCYTVNAVTTVEDFNEYFQADFDQDASDTIGGVVLRKFGRLPKRGERVSVDRFDFQVLHADSRRIRLLQLDCR